MVKNCIGFASFGEKLRVKVPPRPILFYFLGSQEEEEEEGKGEIRGECDSICLF